MDKYTIFNLVEVKCFTANLNKLSEQKNSIEVLTENFENHTPNIIFITTDNLDLLYKYPLESIVGVVRKASDFNTFFENEIVHNIPCDLSYDKLFRYIFNNNSVRQYNRLAQKIRMKTTFPLRDFIIFTEAMFHASANGLAFLTPDFELLFSNSNFKLMFEDIYEVKPIKNKLIYSNLSKPHKEFWLDIIKDSIKKESYHKGYRNSSNNPTSKYYNLHLTLLKQDSSIFGYTIRINDITKLKAVNNDLQRYYNYLLKQNKKLEYANKEIATKNNHLKAAYKKVNSLSRIDYLTQLPNRRHFLEKIEYEQQRFKRHEVPFILAYGDIDDFKKVNDEYGHDAGDFVLVTISKIISSTIRNIDFACRWGGEEFIIFLEEKDIVKGKKAIERVVKNIALEDFTYNGISHNITMTFGLALYNKDEDISICINEADERLYWGKNNGKDQIVISIADQEDSK